MAILPPVAGFIVKLALDKIRSSTNAATRTPFPSDPDAPAPSHGASDGGTTTFPRDPDLAATPG